MKTLDKTLILIATLDILFVIAMIIIFCIYQAVPDVLVASVFAATFGECGCCSYIWKTKRIQQIKEESNVTGNGGVTDQVGPDNSGNYIHNVYSSDAEE